MTTPKTPKKFYAVRSGRKPGIYRTWEECKAQVEGYAGARYKGFPTLQDAEWFMNGAAPPPLPSPRKPAARKTGTASGNLEFTSDDVPAAGADEVVIYTDGACTGNPGPGGYGVVIDDGNQLSELSKGFRLTTNNRMEILGCIAGLRALKEPSRVKIYSDSMYVVNAMNQSWAVRWRRNGWKRTDANGEPRDVANRDLWIQVLDLCGKHRVRFEWVRGHDGNEGNERCDRLARAAAASTGLEIDLAYETPGARVGASENAGDAWIAGDTAGPA